MNRRQKCFAVFLIAGASLGSAGCALLGADPQDDELDPVAAAAQKVRESRNRQPAWISPSANEHVRSALREGEIVPGMQMGEVRAILGSPRDVETAGSEGSGNERWVYPTATTGRYGLGGSPRTIYFEDGRVAGWETGR